MGVIDNSYSGNNDIWKYSAIALRDTKICKNDRICQFRITRKQPEIKFEVVDRMEGEDRKGFGSSGTY
jgi:dUTP pyrophosphatase